MQNVSQNISTSAHLDSGGNDYIDTSQNIFKSNEHLQSVNVIHILKVYQLGIPKLNNKGFLFII